MAQSLDLLRRLTSAFGPSGFEEEVADIIRSEIDGLYDEITCDRMGSIMAILRCGQPNAKRLLVDAHMDEVGFMINSIDDDGYLRFGTVGGIDPRVLCGRRIIIVSEDKTRRTKGLISSKPVHLLSDSERAEATPIDKMYIDIGVETKEEAEKHVSLGDFATFDSEFVEFGDNMIKAKALDDRLGCAAMIETLKKIKTENFKPNFDICFAFTTGEECGLLGAATAAWKFAADKAIVLETTAVADIADVPQESQVATLGKGGAVSLLDRGTIYDRDMVDFVMLTGKKHNIACQLKRYVSGGNDAAVIHSSRDGVKTVAISAPTRYLHTASTVASADDYFSICDLVYKVITELDINL